MNRNDAEKILDGHKFILQHVSEAIEMFCRQNDINLEAEECLIISRDKIRELLASRDMEIINEYRIGG